MSRRPHSILAGACLIAALVLVTAYVDVPQPLRIVPGLLIVFILPGYAAICTVLPGGQLAFEERVVASVGISLAMSTCAAVLLAAVPIGLSRESFAVVLGGCTLLLSLCAVIRALRAPTTER